MEAPGLPGFFKKMSRNGGAWYSWISQENVEKQASKKLFKITSENTRTQPINIKRLTCTPSQHITPLH
jgi:hypothetical protein